MDPRRREQLLQQMRRQFSASQLPAKSDVANTITSAPQLPANTSHLNTAAMPQKRRIIELDGDGDPEILEMSATPPTGARARKAPRTMPPTPRSTSSPNASRPAPGVAAPAHQHDFFTLSVRTIIDSNFFPDRTLSLIAELRRLELQAIMQTYESNMRIIQEYRYTIISETSTDSSKGFSTHPVGPSSPSLSFVNAQLLQLFLARNPRLTALKERPKFVWLASIKGAKNPRFAHLHAVRYDEVGCGFDEDHCLSLFLSELLEGERRTKVLYVEKTAVEVEEEKKGDEGAGASAREIKVEGQE